MTITQKSQYQVIVSRQDDSRAIAQTRGHEVTLNIKKGSGETGFNAAETLLAALGACMLTNVNAISSKMHLQIDDACIEFLASRSDDPAIMTAIRYKLTITSPEATDKLVELFELSKKWGTVSNTIIFGLEPQGELIALPSKKVNTTNPHVGEH